EGSGDPFAGAAALRGLARLRFRHPELPAVDWESFSSAAHPALVRAVAREILAAGAQSSGYEWAAAYAPPAPTLLSAAFVSPSLAFACGFDGAMLASRDAARTWDLLPRFTDGALRAIAFADEETGLAVGSFGICLRTQNGGRSWEARPRLCRQRLHALTLDTTGLGIAAGEGRAAWVTRDAGLSWERVALSPRATVRRLAIAPGGEVWAVGDEGLLLVAHEAGRRWEKVPVPVCEDLLGVSFAGGDSGWIVGRTGTVLHSADTGRSWQRQRPDQRQRDFYAVCAAGTQEGWIAGGGRGSFYAPIEHTTDGGRTWTSLPSHVTDTLHDLAWNGEGVFCAVGRYGRIPQCELVALRVLGQGDEFEPE
ncbi:MAG: YCF48-related protein, partial [Candidatus Binatia bacterium]